MAAITTSQVALRRIGSSSPPAQRRGSGSPLKGILVAVPAGAVMWGIAIALFRTVLA